MSSTANPDLTTILQLAKLFQSAKSTAAALCPAKELVDVLKSLPLTVLRRLHGDTTAEPPPNNDESAADTPVDLSQDWQVISSALDKWTITENPTDDSIVDWVSFEPRLAVVQTSSPVVLSALQPRAPPEDPPQRVCSPLLPHVHGLPPAFSQKVPLSLYLN